MRCETELYVKSAARSAPFTRAKAPLWHASRTTIVSVEGSALSRSRKVVSGISSPPSETAFDRACPE